nr:hypothetical protein CDS [Bradyrhizobium sp.]
MHSAAIMFPKHFREALDSYIRNAELFPSGLMPIAPFFLIIECALLIA